MYRIASGSTRGLSDTERFVRLLDGLRAGGHEGLAGFFDGAGDLTVARAPGRLDLMGGIADYSGSLVLELPISNATHVALQLREEKTLRVASLGKDGERPRLFEMALADFQVSGRPAGYAEAARFFRRDSEHGWAAYVAGAFLVLMREKGCVFDRGARILISSDVPEGKGVSSSAALEVATMRAVSAAYGIELPPRELAFLCQKVENLVACAPCGVMDQMTLACGEEGRLLALLCQPAEPKGFVELPEELAVWGIDSGIRHSVGGADYGTVRTAAFMGYRIIAEAAGLSWRESAAPGHVLVDDPKWGGYLANLRPAEFEGRYAALLPERTSGEEFLARYKGITDAVTSVDPARSYPVRDATRHPVFENDRVERFARLLRDWQGLARADELGGLMYLSHESYSACGLGSPGTDELVRLVRESGPAAGLYGAKITGGGGGGTVAVLGRRGAGGAVEAVAREYAARTGRAPLVISGSSPGAAAFGSLRLKAVDSSQ
ncbi:MAG TPA: galactokinase family protein [Pyrinomonadaceae bacterium]|nr:galactokinase family protein [Pyrinomonadaceae bacterium]